MTITHAFSPDEMCWRLYATDHGHTAIAGPRLFRAPPHPDIQFAHDSAQDAERDAATLRAYLDALPAQKKRKSKDKSAYD
jgi:hypothetical protein